MRAIINGGVTPKGIVKVSGAKNSATRLLSAALLTDSTVELSSFPTQLVDVGHKIRFIRALGGRIDVDDASGAIVVDSSNFKSTVLEDYDYPIRTTYLLVAGQILRSGVARIPYPGGCKIGSRGYDLHIMVWRQLGCEVEELPDYIEVRGGRFKGGEIRFPISTVGGTENALICAAIAEGSTEIINAYITPEIEDLIDLLKRMGAQIEVFGNSHIRVHGRGALSGARKNVMYDRIEALTWIVYAIMTRGELLIEGVPFEAMRSPLLYIESAGVDLLANSNSIYVHPGCIKEGRVQPFEVPCGAHPGVISDMQPFFTMLGLSATGVSRVFDYRYPERVGYVHELARFCQPGALEAEHGKITVHGPGVYRAAEATSTDLRGSMALILAALCADGRSVVNDAHMALRGYNDLKGKLAKVGVEIEVQESDEPALAAIA
ncbi:UDP-N-acetylglucosamine 1-carboxyvinyltransferase [Caulobacter sp. SL161]|uniref:UDP-N-acetylglucosamine 1-carboxyvinyltransferase n=1 Tax=Caulobacter sp. SL161 TaxID=2995156 RepID=UPI0022741275|nr:UDP-N-acetylglucosamine 1-carboxyvinyltransferase [Caulobacter sp. SL161]MCY1648411.1 UDP-N-acetylglucosamine 1-carboxyvinyltransferase [Caulobacter sp. SL161]